jgi:hypothetical protein
MNMKTVRRIGLFLSLGALCASLSAQAPAPAQGAGGAPGGAAAGRGGGGGGAGGGGAGGRGGAPAVAFTTSQLLTLGKWDTAALTTAATQALTELRTASLTLGTKPKDLTDKAAALAKAETALALVRADLFAKIQASPDKLNAEQVGYVRTNNGLNRGGNTSPGMTQAYSDYTGFTQIWDGKTFTGWNGEMDGWMIKDDAINMDVARLPGQHHIHFVGIPGVSPILKDFDFKVEFKASAGGFNGGVQYRSRLLSAARSKDGKARGIFDAATMADPFGKAFPANITTLAEAQKAGLVPAGAGNPWQVSGYQFDITGNNLGSLYEGQGRGVIVNAGEVVQLAPGGVKFVIGRTADTPAQYTHENKGLDGEWNQIEIIVRGNTMIHMLNGHVITVTTDDDPMRRASQGMLSLQCEGGSIWYRNVYLKTL